MAAAWCGPQRTRLRFYQIRKLIYSRLDGVLFSFDRDLKISVYNHYFVGHKYFYRRTFAWKNQ